MAVIVNGKKNEKCKNASYFICFFLKYVTRLTASVFTLILFRFFLSSVLYIGFYVPNII